MSLALRTFPHVVAADGGFQHVGQFHVGEVSVKYEDKKVAGTILQGSTAQLTSTRTSSCGRASLHR